MIRFSGGRLRALALAAPALAFLAGVGLNGCGRNGGDLPAGFAPQGQVGTNFLFTQVIPFGPNQEPAVSVTIFDQTVSSEYRVYRSVNSGPFDLAGLYTASHAGTFSSATQTFGFVDTEAPVGQFLTYMARGVVNGEETTSSPVTNFVTVPPASNPTDLYPLPFDLIHPVSTQQDVATVDTLPLFTWEPVAGATRYALQIVRNDGRLFFLGLTPNATPSYQYGSGGGLIVQDRPLTLPSTFVWAAAALDVDSRIIGSTNFAVFQVDTMQVPLRAPTEEDRAAFETARAQLLFAPAGPR